MLKIERNNRLEIENEYLALLLNKPDLFSIVQIKPEYLCSKQNQKIFTYAKECFEEYDCLKPLKIFEKHRDFDIDYFVELLEDTMWYNSNWKKQLELSEESIVKFYKEDVIRRLTERLEKDMINYDEYVQQIKKLDDIVLTERTIVLTAKEIIEKINENMSRVNLNRFPVLNRNLRLVQGDFVIIGATTGMGKSGFMLNLMNDLMTGFQCVYFNMEMSKSTIYKRIVSINAGIPIDDVLNPKSDYQKEIVVSALKKIEESNLIVEHKANNIKEIKSIMMKVKDSNKHTVLFIDHLGLTKCDDKKTLYEQATEVAKELRQMCLEYDCTIISASQLNRSAYSSEQPTLSMLKDSGELENSASKVILLYGDKDNPKHADKIKMNVEIVKNRDGICGIIPMEYDKPKQIFKEVVKYGN